MIILGVDPGYERLGIAILEKGTLSNKPKVVYSTCFKTSKEDEHAERLLKIQKELESLIKKYKPVRLGIESLFFNTNQKTVVKVAEARGVILSTAKKFNLEIIELTPLQIKVAVTGYGRSDKKSVIKMIPSLVELQKKENMLDDEYDAIAIAITALISNLSYKK